MKLSHVLLALIEAREGKKALQTPQENMNKLHMVYHASTCHQWDFSSSSPWQTSVHISLPYLLCLISLCTMRQNIPSENNSESITTATVSPFDGNSCFSLEPQS